MADPSSEIRRKPPEPTGHKTQDAQAPSFVPKDSIEIEVASTPELFAQGDRPSAEAQITRLSIRDASWQALRNSCTPKNLWGMLIVAFALTIANIFQEPLMKRWGAKGLWAGFGCWLFLYIVVFIGATIVYGMVFGKRLNTDEEKGKKKESGEVERDVEAELGVDASRAPNALGFGERQVRSYG
jgi:hypothetical protein